MSDAWVGVVGALGGTILGAGLTFLIARWQASREDELRRVAERRAAYARFHAVVEGAYLAIKHHVSSEDPERAGKVSASLAAMQLAQQGLVMVATVDAIEKAMDVTDRLIDLAEVAMAPGLLVKSGDPWIEGGKLQVAADAYRRTLHDFLFANRDDLGADG